VTPFFPLAICLIPPPPSLFLAFSVVLSFSRVRALSRECKSDSFLGTTARVTLYIDSRSLSKVTPAWAQPLASHSGSLSGVTLAWAQKQESLSRVTLPKVTLTWAQPLASHSCSLSGVTLAWAQLQESLSRATLSKVTLTWAQPLASHSCSLQESLLLGHKRKSHSLE